MELSTTRFTVPVIPLTFATLIRIKTTQIRTLLSPTTKSPIFSVFGEKTASFGDQLSRMSEALAQYWKPSRNTGRTRTATPKSRPRVNPTPRHHQARPSTVGPYAWL